MSETNQDTSPSHLHRSSSGGANRYQANRGSTSSAHAPSATNALPAPPAAAGSSPTSSRRGHRPSVSQSSMPDPTLAMNNLQTLIDDMKGQSNGNSPGNSTPHRDANAELSAIGDRLAAQEEQLKSQLQQQLNLQSSRGALAAVGENDEGFSAPSASLTAGPPLASSSPSLARHSISVPPPRFAGNAAFQSAIARHAQGNARTSQDLRALAHQRQISLQGRFAELGYNTTGAGGISGIPTDYDEDEIAPLADFSGNDALRRLQTQDAAAAAAGSPVRRRASDISAMTANGLNQQRGTATYPTQTELLASQMALQQQIEVLQLQQQQLLQQQMNFNAQPSPPSAGTQAAVSGAGHRRIQSHASQTGLSPANFNMGGIGSIGATSSAASGAGSLDSTNSRGGGHSRRHSHTVKSQPPLEFNFPDPAPGLMQPNPGFSFPNTARLQQPHQQQPTHHHQQGSMDMSGLPNLGAIPGPLFGRPPSAGHFSHPSVQLSSALTPEYLMAGGGLLNLSNLSMGGELADGFAGGAGIAGRMTGHSRTASQARRINGMPGSMPPVADLAQAQAQLSSLHQFRTQASGGGGHNKSASLGGGFNPALMGQQPGLGGHFGFGMPQPPQAQGQGAAAQRKALFGSYLPQSSLPPLLAAGKIVVGQLRVDKRNRSDAYVATEVLDSDIYISGSRDRNRALSGDIVDVELLDPQEVWLNKKAKEDKKKHKEEQGTLAKKPDKAKDDLEVEGGQLRLIDEEEDTEQAPPALAGHVVAIVERASGQLFCGTIGLLRPSSAATKEKQQADRGGRDASEAAGNQARPKIVWHRPLNKTTPLIAIPADQAPEAFWEPGGQEKYANIIVTVAIKRWPITSLHPFGTLVEEIGPTGDVDAETQAILKDNIATATEEFPENALKCIPPSPFSVSERDVESRRDFRDTLTVTIDPPTAKDLDDAISVQRLDGGLYEIGVHIADVSHFVKLNSALDREARKRCTTVYLVQKAYPMLPAPLSEESCSLVPGVERLCFSAVFTMNKEARIIGTWFGRTVIKSAAQLAYGDAQAVIEDAGGIPEDKIKVKTHSAAQIAEDIKLLHGLTQKMKARRFDDGALRIDNVKLSFRLDEDGMPMDSAVHRTREANNLIEELMLAANIAVSHKIAAGLPDASLLRRHEKPLQRRLEGFQRRAKQMGYDLDISSGGALYASLRGVTNVQHRLALESLVTKGMQRAKYFCAGMTDIAKYGHFALNVPLYTHFTSPIRRYADIMVHRQLDAVLQGNDKFAVDKESIAKIAQQCNVKRDAAKLAQEQSQHLFLCLLIHDLTVRYGPVVRQAVVTGVLDAAFDVVIPEFGIEKRVHMDQMPVEHHTFDEKTQALSIYWKKGVDTIAWLAETSEDAHVLALRARAVEGEGAEAHRDSEAALFEDDEEPAEAGATASSTTAATQRSKSASYRSSELSFNSVERTSTGHVIQTVQLLDTVPVVVSASVGLKSPPVITVFAVNPAGRDNVAATKVDTEAKVEGEAEEGAVPKEA